MLRQPYLVKVDLPNPECIKCDNKDPHIVFKRIPLQDRYVSFFLGGEQDGKANAGNEDDHTHPEILHRGKPFECTGAHDDSYEQGESWKHKKNREKERGRGIRREAIKIGDT